MPNIAETPISPILHCFPLAWNRDVHVHKIQVTRMTGPLVTWSAFGSPDAMDTYSRIASYSWHFEGRVYLSRDIPVRLIDRRLVNFCRLSLADRLDGLQLRTLALTIWYPIPLIAAELNVTFKALAVKNIGTKLQWRPVPYACIEWSTVKQQKVLLVQVDPLLLLLRRYFSYLLGASGIVSGSNDFNLSNDVWQLVPYRAQHHVATTERCVVVEAFEGQQILLLQWPS